MARSAKIPQLQKNVRMPDAERKRVGEALLREYEKGKSIRQLCAETGYSIGRVRRLLIDAGVEFRRRGGSTRSRAPV
jgi:hypothetical protein